MSKITVPFKYVSIGEIEVDAISYEEATKLAERRLVDLRNLGTITNSRSDSDITWLDDELEVDGWEAEL